MSGPTYTLNLKKRITYAEFKALPEGLQKSYVQNVIDKYRVGPSALAELMGANAGAVGVYSLSMTTNSFASVASCACSMSASASAL